ncbi:MAG TPA: ATP-binding protein [Candidatus Limiplasma sp.]|mgnify:CR=1 FL=1|nr:ATP-binding protein [Candidatus Limiplasma sp.]
MNVVQWLKRDTEELDLHRSIPQKASLRFTRILRSVTLMFVIIALATLVSVGFRSLGFSEMNYIMTYNLGVVLIAYFSEGYVYCVIASFFSMLAYNFFFTVPYYTLIAYSPEYPVTFISMLLSALIASTITTRARIESRLAENRERRVQILYRLEKNLLAVHSKTQLLETTAKDLNELFGVSILVTAADLSGQLSMRYVEGTDVFLAPKEQAALQECFQSGVSCGDMSELFSSSVGHYRPIIGSSGVLGVIGIAFPEGLLLGESQKLFLDAITAQLALAMERERLYEKQQRVKLEVEREHLRGDLLRSVSHDLRTPLTGMLGSVGTLLDHYDELDDSVRRELLTDIYNETEWLSALVENVLSLTRLESHTVKLQKQPEAVEEIIAESVSRMERRADQHPISVHIPDDLLLVPMDGTLIEQVLINLLNNAIQHTPDGTPITVTVTRESHQAVFEVSDRGPGIPPEALPHLFERFYTRPSVPGERKGAGLGLSICKSIIEAHNGTLSAGNLPEGGARFRFTLPLEDVV